MEIDRKYLISNAKKVRIADHLYQRLEQLAEKRGEEGVSLIKLTEEALESYLRERGQPDPDITPRNSTERELIFMLLALFREPQDTAEQAVLTLLKRVYGNRRPK
jgi:hypothetical protein